MEGRRRNANPIVVSPLRGNCRINFIGVGVFNSVLASSILFSLSK